MLADEMADGADCNLSCPLRHSSKVNVIKEQMITFMKYWFIDLYFFKKTHDMMFKHKMSLYIHKITAIIVTCR